jgi:hypothetical protein
MKMKRTLILILMIAIMLPMVFVGCDDPQTLSKREKAEILEIYNAKFPEGYHDYMTYEPLVWFDESGNRRDDGVSRYFGTYGDCIVLIKYKGVEQPITIYHLSRLVEYPVSCEIWLVNKDPNAPLKSNNPEYPYDLFSPFCSLYGLATVDIQWLTDEELEQLTTDLENWLAEGNY